MSVVRFGTPLNLAGCSQTVSIRALGFVWNATTWNQEVADVRSISNGRIFVELRSATWPPRWMVARFLAGVAIAYFSRKTACLVVGALLAAKAIIRLTIDMSRFEHIDSRGSNGLGAIIHPQHLNVGADEDVLGAIPFKLPHGFAQRHIDASQAQVASNDSDDEVIYSAAPPTSAPPSAPELPPPSHPSFKSAAQATRSATRMANPPAPPTVIPAPAPRLTVPISSSYPPPPPYVSMSSFPPSPSHPSFASAARAVGFTTGLNPPAPPSSSPAVSMSSSFSQPRPMMATAEAVYCVGCGTLRPPKLSDGTIPNSDSCIECGYSFKPVPFMVPMSIPYPTPVAAPAMVAMPPSTPVAPPPETTAPLRPRLKDVATIMLTQVRFRNTLIQTKGSLILEDVVLQPSVTSAPVVPSVPPLPPLLLDTDDFDTSMAKLAQLNKHLSAVVNNPPPTVPVPPAAPTLPKGANFDLRTLTPVFIKVLRENQGHYFKDNSMYRAETAKLNRLTRINDYEQGEMRESICRYYLWKLKERLDDLVAATEGFNKYTYGCLDLAQERAALQSKYDNALYMHEDLLRNLYAPPAHLLLLNQQIGQAKLELFDQQKKLESLQEGPEKEETAQRIAFLNEKIQEWNDHIDFVIQSEGSSASGWREMMSFLADVDV
jgi:hypothetical protein